MSQTRIDRAGAPSGPVVSGFSGRGFRIDDEVHDGGVLLTPLAATAWSPPALEDLVEADLAALLALDPPPEFLLLGTGARMTRPSPRLTAALEARGIGLEAMDSRAAARAWAVLRAEDRWIAAALMPL